MNPLTGFATLRWSRRGDLKARSCILGLLALCLWLSACRDGSRTSTPPPEEPKATATTESPSSVKQILAATSEDRTKLAAWAKDQELEPVIRHTSARRLETLGAPEVVPVAVALSGEADSFLHLNGLAILGRLAAQGDESAKKALHGLPREKQGLAAKLGQQQ